MSPHKTKTLHFLQNKDLQYKSSKKCNICCTRLFVFGLMIISFVLSLISSSNTHAATSTLSMTVSNSIAVDVLPTANGSFVTSSSTDTNISVTTNHYTGYTLGITAKTNNSNALINTSDSNKTIPSISNAISE